MELIFDTHAHLNDEAFDQDREELIRNLQNDGIELVMIPGADPKSSKEAVELAEKYENLYAAVGTHPHDAETFTDEDFEMYRDLCKKEKVLAVGEIGLDYYYDNSPRDIQKEVFIKQLELAEEEKLPVIIHSRDAIEDTYDILKAFEGRVKGIIHCYSSSYEMAEKFIALGYYISLGGPVTFKNAKTPKIVAEKVDINWLLIETDSPYLAPHPMRGKRNEPKYTRYVAEQIAILKGMEMNDLIKITKENAKRCFGLCK